MSRNVTGTDVRKSLTRNMSIMFGAQLITWVSSFVLLYFLPRYLGSEDFGRLYLALSINMMLGLLIDFGGSYLIPKEVARSEKGGGRILSSYILMRVGLWLLSIGLVMLLAGFLGYSEHIYLLILTLAVGKLWEGGGKALKSFFYGIERMEYPSLASIAEKLFVASAAVTVLLLGADSKTIAVVFTAGSLINLVVIYLLSRSFINIEFSFDRRVFSLFRSGMPYFLFSLFSVIYYRIDAVMISAITSETVTGWYGGAYRFFDIVMVLPLLYKTAIFPIFSKLWDNREGVLESTFGESLRFMIILGLPVSVLITFFASPIIGFFMGLEEYGPSVVILQLFAVSIPFIFIDLILGSAIMGAANRQKAWAVVGFLAIIVNVGLNSFLISYTQTVYLNGGIGAAAATLVTELFVMGAAVYLLPKEYFSMFKLSYFLRPALATLLMMIPVYYMISIHLYWMIGLVLSGILYLLLLYAVGTFNRQEVGLIKEFLSWEQLKMTFSENKS